MTERSGKTGHVTLGVWFDEDAGDIHLTVPGHGFSTVSNNRDHARGNPHLFNKLAKALRDLGKPHPAIIEEWDRGAAN